MAKKWGQHFLIRQGVVEKMLNHAAVQKGDQVLEIGPGKGFLTHSLLRRGAEVTAVEIDPQLCYELRERFGEHQAFTLLERDVMKMDPGEFSVNANGSVKLVANLPYQITSRLIMRLIPFRRAWKSMTMMVQKEIADRICATSVNRKQYGALSLATGMAFDCLQFLKVPPAAFRPPPKVDSALLHLVPRVSGLESEQEVLFLEWSQRLFGHRRKTLVNSIRHHYPDWHRSRGNLLKKDWKGLRPENLTLEEWLNLFKEYSSPSEPTC